MRERMELLGGALEVTSGPGEGARVEASAPLEGL
jgi:signal transduction histidine kinase